MYFDAFNVLSVHVNKEEIDLVMISHLNKVKSNHKNLFYIYFYSSYNVGILFLVVCTQFFSLRLT